MIQHIQLLYVIARARYNSNHTLSTMRFSDIGIAIGLLTYAYDSNKNKTRENVGGIMSLYSFTPAGITYDTEERLTATFASLASLVCVNLKQAGDRHSDIPEPFGATSS